MHNRNPWLVALIAWASATGLVSGIYALWLARQGKAMNWELVGEAAALAIPLALFMAWKDRRR